MDIDLKVDMTLAEKKLKNISRKIEAFKIRQAILKAALDSGIKNANQFGNMAVKIGACSKRHAQDYYGGKFDLSTKKADIFLKHFKLKIRK